MVQFFLVWSMRQQWCLQAVSFENIIGLHPHGNSSNSWGPYTAQTIEWSNQQHAMFQALKLNRRSANSNISGTSLDPGLMLRAQLDDSFRHRKEATDSLGPAHYGNVT